jgi:hypothetical protein
MSYTSGTEILLNEGLHDRSKKAGFLNINDNGAEVLGVAVNSVSFSNVGATPVTLTVNGGTYDLPAGASVSFDAGGNQNKFPSGTFEYDTTGGTLLIAYTW